MAGYKLYYYPGRRTAVVATSAKAARAKCKRGCTGTPSVKTPTAAQNKAIKAGRWVGTPKSRKNLRGYGPKPSK
jgi:hypothetical protein